MSEELNIKITTQGDTSGAKKVEEALKAVNAAVQEGGTAQEAAATGANKLSEKLKEQTKETKFLGLSHEELHEAVKKVGEEFPLVGKAAKLAANPIMGAIDLIISAFIKCKEKLAEWNKELDEAGAKAAERADHFGRLKDAQLEAAKSAETLRIELEHAKTSERDLAGEGDRLIETYHRLNAAQLEIADAKAGAAIAKINELERSGKLTPEQAIKARSTTTEAFAAEKERLKQHELDQAALIKQRTLDAATKQQPALDQAAKDADAKAHDTHRTIKLKDAEEQIGKGDAEVKETKQKRLKALERFSQAQANLKTNAALAEGHPTDAGLQSAKNYSQAEFDEASNAKDLADQNAREAAKRRKEAYDTKQRLDEALQAADAAAAAAKDRAVKNAEASKAGGPMEQAAQKARQEADINFGVHTEKTQAQHEAAIADAGNTGRVPSGRANYEALLEQHRLLEEQLAKAQQTLLQVLQETGANRDKHLIAITQTIETLKKRDLDLESQIKANKTFQ